MRGRCFFNTEQGGQHANSAVVIGRTACSCYRLDAGWRGLTSSGIGSKRPASWRAFFDGHRRRDARYGTSGLPSCAPSRRSSKVKLERGDAGEFRRSRRQFWGGRPADGAVDQALAVALFVNRAARVAGAGAKSRRFATRCRIKQTQLHIARLAGGDKVGTAQHRGGAVVARGGNAITDDGEFSPTATGALGRQRRGGNFAGSDAASLSSATSAVARLASKAFLLNCGCTTVFAISERSACARHQARKA